ncbi:hypothetical protein J6590_094551 [Homalodisca vitripennis]|nr:hypothetical protein J6590_094551 [Homalodisca vitripennis]
MDKRFARINHKALKRYVFFTHVTCKCGEEQSDRDRRHLARRFSSRGEVLARLEQQQRYLYIYETRPPLLLNLNKPSFMS